MPRMMKKIVDLEWSEVQRFEARHPERGAFTWFVREALKRYNDLNPDPGALVQVAIEDMNFLK